MNDENIEEAEDVQEILEEVKTRNVKDLLVEMKNLSELIIDLAYSAVLYDNEELADDVVELEEHINKLKYEVEIMSMLAARTPEDAAQLTGILRVASAAEEISNAAREVADTVIRDVELHPALKDAIKESQETIIRLKVDTGSQMVGKSLEDLKLETETGMHVIAMKRTGGEWIPHVKKKTVVEEGDMLIAIGPMEGVEELKKLRG